MSIDSKDEKELHSLCKALGKTLSKAIGFRLSILRDNIRLKRDLDGNFTVFYTDISQMLLECFDSLDAEKSTNKKE